MIIKNFEINKINIKTNPFILFHGKNEGSKNKAIDDLVKKKYHKLRRKRNFRQS